MGTNGVLKGGGFFINESSDVIIRNLSIRPGLKEDAITIQNSKHVWIDHCDLYSDVNGTTDTIDGLLDITHASDFITVSWTHFHDHNHSVSLVGHSDNNAAEDTGFFHVTFHHNWYTDVASATPRVRFGKVHVFNNYYQGVKSNAVISVMGGSVLAEANLFEQVTVPATTHYENSKDGFMDFRENSIASDSGPNGTIAPLSSAWIDEYTYDADSIDTVRFLVPFCAGVGNILDP